MKKETLLSERRTEDAIFGDVNGANVQLCYEKSNIQFILKPWFRWEWKFTMDITCVYGVVYDSWQCIEQVFITNKQYQKIL